MTEEEAKALEEEVRAIVALAQTLSRQQLEIFYCRWQICLRLDRESEKHIAFDWVKKFLNPVKCECDKCELHIGRCNAAPAVVDMVRRDDSEFKAVYCQRCADSLSKGRIWVRHGG